jgi:hypothetical protein
VNDGGNDGVEVFQDGGRGNPKRCEAASVQLLIPNGIALGAIASIVGLAIHLDREAGFQAGEIELVAGLRSLAAELEAAGSFSQLLP